MLRGKGNQEMISYNDAKKMKQLYSKNLDDKSERIENLERLLHQEILKNKKLEEKVEFLNNLNLSSKKFHQEEIEGLQFRLQKEFDEILVEDQRILKNKIAELENTIRIYESNEKEIIPVNSTVNSTISDDEIYKFNYMILYVIRKNFEISPNQKIKKCDVHKILKKEIMQAFNEEIKIRSNTNQISKILRTLKIREYKYRDTDYYQGLKIKEKL